MEDLERPARDIVGLQRSTRRRFLFGLLTVSLVILATSTVVLGAQAALLPPARPSHHPPATLAIVTINSTCGFNGSEANNWSAPFCIWGSAAPGSSWNFTFVLENVVAKSSGGARSIDSVQVVGATELGISPALPSSVPAGSDVKLTVTIAVPGTGGTTLNPDFVIYSH